MGEIGGEIVIVKCGGSVLESLSNEFFQSIKALKEAGKQPIIVHGGGPSIQQLLEQLKIESQFVDGLRKTSTAVLRVVDLVLSGELNGMLVRRLQKAGVAAVGLSGYDGGLLKAKAKDVERLGLVGEVMEVNASFLHQLLAMEMVPVIAPVAMGLDGADRYNVNADSAAGVIAAALGASKLLFVTDVAGIIINNQVVEEVTTADIHAMVADGTIYGGMIPKVEAALHSLQGGIHEAMIVSGLSSLMVGGEMIGTTIKKSTGVLE